MQVSTTTARSLSRRAVGRRSPAPLPSQAQPLSRNSSFSGNLKGAKSVSDIEMLKHAADPDDDRQVIRLPRPCSRQNNGSRSTTDMPRSVSFSDETGRHRTCASSVEEWLRANAISHIACPAMSSPRP